MEIETKPTSKLTKRKFEPAGKQHKVILKMQEELAEEIGLPIEQVKVTVHIYE